MSSKLTCITHDNDSVIALLQELRLYEQMMLAQNTGQDVLLLHENYLFIWSIDEYILYHSHCLEELEQIALKFQQSALEIKTAIRH